MLGIFKLNKFLLKANNPKKQTRIPNTKTTKKDFKPNAVKTKATKTDNKIPTATETKNLSKKPNLSSKKLAFFKTKKPNNKNKKEGTTKISNTSKRLE